MVTSLCRATNPATCRYHGSKATAVALTLIHAAHTKYMTATTFSEKSEAKVELEEAQDVYDATDHGYKALRGAYREASLTHDFLETASLSSRIIKAKLARSEEKQDGSVTTTTVLTPSSMRNRTQRLAELVRTANSDMFLDVFDKYSSGLHSSIDENDVEEYVKNYNVLVDELVETGNSVTWLNKEDGEDWVAAVNSTRLSGSFFKTARVGDLGNYKMTFVV